MVLIRTGTGQYTETRRQHNQPVALGWARAPTGGHQKKPGAPRKARPASDSRSVSTLFSLALEQVENYCEGKQAGEAIRSQLADQISNVLYNITEKDAVG